MKKIAIYSLALSALALGACSQDDPQQLSGTDGQIILKSTVATRTANTSLQQTQVAQGVQVGVFVVGGASTVYDNAMLTADGAGNFSGDALYFPSEGSVSIYSYAPYTQGWQYGNNTFTVASNQSTDAGYLASDLLYGVPAGSNSFDKKQNSPISIAYSHQLAKVTVVFNVSPDIDLTNAQVNILNTLTTTSFDVATGTLGAASGSPVTINAGQGDVSGGVSAVIVPQNLAAGTEFIQVVLGEKALNAKLGTSVDISAGKSYTYTVNVKGDIAEIELASTVTDWVDGGNLTGDVEEVEAPALIEYAKFQTPGANATYNTATGDYTWSQSSNNLMTIFEFANGELAQYQTLYFKFTNLAGDNTPSVRIGYYVGQTYTEIGSGYYNAGEKSVALSTLGVDLSTVTRIVFGGKSGSGSCTIFPEDCYLEGKGSFGGNTGDNTGGDTETPDTPGEPSGDTWTATFQTPGANASYNASTNTYSWTESNNNLMKVFEFTNGELANYKTLTFTFSDNNGAGVRCGYYIGNDFTSFNGTSGYYTAGKKEINLVDIIGAENLSKVTSIAFGGLSSSGSCIVKPSDFILSK